MAMYHFSLHKDKKPDGSKVMAYEHVDYIKRDGKYKNSDKVPDNYIRTSPAASIFDGKIITLYKSEFGDITSGPNGLRISGNASPTTISIAMMIAHACNPDAEGLDIQGSNLFKSKSVRAALDTNLPIQFLDPEMKKIHQTKKEILEHERREFEQNNGRTRTFTGVSKPDTDGDFKHGLSLSETPSLSNIPSVSELPKLHVDGIGQEDAAMLLHNHAREQLDDQGTKSNPSVRWDLSRSRRRLAIQTAKDIVKNIEKYQDQVYAASHVEYINREAAFAQKGGCIYTEHRLPGWAKDSPKKFFKAADRYEGKGNLRYLEFQFALPNELSLEQNQELIKKFIEKEIPNHYYTYAIHDKVGAMSDGAHNLHVHLMFSERLIDDVELEKERAASNYFSYPKRNAKTIEERRKGGAMKDHRFKEREFLMIARKDFADITNEILEKYGKPDRVDYRSIKAMRNEAKMNGDTYLVSLLNRLPESSLGPTISLLEDDPRVKKIKQLRKDSQFRQDKLFEVDKLEHEIKELELKEYANGVYRDMQILMNSPEFSQIADDDEYLTELRQDFLDAKKDAQGWKRMVSWTDDVMEEAKVSFLSQDEDREYWQKYRELCNQLEHWEIFNDSIDLDVDDVQLQQSYMKLLSGIGKKIKDLSAEIDKMKPHFEELEKSLEEISTRKRIQSYVHRKLFDDKHARQMFDQSHQHLASTIKTLNQALFNDLYKENSQDTFTLKELYAILRRRYFGLYKEYQNALREEKKLATRVISPERAYALAENVYTKGAWKTHRTDKKAFRKKETNLANRLNQIRYQKEQILKMIHPLTTSAELQKLIRDEKALLPIQEALNTEKTALIKREAELRTICDKPHAIEKIQEISLGILKKNQPTQKDYEIAKRNSAHLAQLVDKAKREMNAVKDRLSNEKSDTKYKYVHPQGAYQGSGSRSDLGARYNSSEVNTPSIIAEAIMGNTAAVQVVARETKGMDKEWSMMTVFEKEEMKNKAILRDI